MNYTSPVFILTVLALLFSVISLIRPYTYPLLNVAVLLVCIAVLILVHGK